jgi:glycosyltransferase involved in cell wall biosynthesis
MILGKTSEELASQFVIDVPHTRLGSKSTNGLRRVIADCKDEALAFAVERFKEIASSVADSELMVVTQTVAPPPCIHRGSARNVCCGSPQLWICKKLQVDCVATNQDKQMLVSAVETPEAQAIAACDTCVHREEASVNRIVELDTATIAVVIPCHNYARFLVDCLRSIKASRKTVSQIIVVDDSSSDDPKSVVDQFEGVQYVRCEVRDVHEARGIGFQHVACNYVAFIDADDMIPEDYFADAMAVFKEDRRIAIAYPQLEYFDGAAGPAHGTERAPLQLTADDIEQRNWIPAGSVLRTELVHQSLVFRAGKIDASKCWSQDWRIAKTILRSGPWIARKMNARLHYRKHGSNMSARPNNVYWHDADFENETLTIVIAFSGRWNVWGKLRDWLLSQTWPQQQLRLMIINSHHAALTTAMLGLEDWQGSIQIERVDAGVKHLANEERRNNPGVGKAVEAAVGAVYNTAIRLLGTEYAVILEDDVVPHQKNAIELLLREMGPWVSGVSGVYRQRYQADKCCAFKLPFLGNESFSSLNGEGVEEVDGTGFGLLLTRRSLLRRFPLSGDGPNKFFDCEFAANCKAADNGWWKRLLHRGVTADHFTGDEFDETRNDKVSGWNPNARSRKLPNAVKQTTPTNCFQACVASLLGIRIEEVPSACDGATWDWDAFQDWLAERNMQAIELTFENGGTIYPVRKPVMCILTGESPRECVTGRHAVVGEFIGMEGFNILFDPHPSDRWINGEPTHAVFFVSLSNP